MLLTIPRRWFWCVLILNIRFTSKLADKTEMHIILDVSPFWSDMTTYSRFNNVIEHPKYPKYPKYLAIMDNKASYFFLGCLQTLEQFKNIGDLLTLS